VGVDEGGIEGLPYLSVEEETKDYPKESFWKEKVQRNLGKLGKGSGAVTTSKTPEELISPRK